MPVQFAKPPTMQPAAINNDYWYARLRSPPTKSPRAITTTQPPSTHSPTIDIPTDDIDAFRRRSVPRIFDMMQEVNKINNDIGIDLHHEIEDINSKRFDKISDGTVYLLIFGVFAFLWMMLYLAYKVQSRRQKLKLKRRIV